MVRLQENQQNQNKIKEYLCNINKENRRNQMQEISNSKFKELEIKYKILKREYQQDLKRQKVNQQTKETYVNTIKQLEENIYQMKEKKDFVIDNEIKLTNLWEKVNKIQAQKKKLKEKLL